MMTMALVFTVIDAILNWRQYNNQASKPKRWSNGYEIYFLLLD